MEILTKRPIGKEWLEYSANDVYDLPWIFFEMRDLIEKYLKNILKKEINQ